MISQREFYELYNKNSPFNKNRNLGAIDAKLFLRDLSLPVAYFCAKKGISANTITVVFLLISLLANALFAIPSIYTILSLIIIHETAQLLDCVDGQLARYHGVSSKYGKSFDTLAHVLISGTFMLAFGIRLYLQDNQIIFLILGGVGAFAKSFEQQLEIEKISILEALTLKKIYYHSRLGRYFMYGFQSMITEVRIFVVGILLLTLIQPIVTGIRLVELSFVVMVLVTFLESLVYRIYLSIKQLNLVERKVWKGWS